MAYELHEMDCRLAMSLLMEPDSVDSIVCDPPYGLSKEPDMAEVLRHWLAGDDYTHGGSGFMGKTWDSFVPGPSVWREAYRVLKPGGYLIAFFGTRTYDLGTLAIRLAGFEIRDQLAWVFGSGFPKSLDVSKAIDKTKRRDYVLAAVSLGLKIPGNNLHDWTKADHAPGDVWWGKFKQFLSVDQWAAIEREVIGFRKGVTKTFDTGATAIIGNRPPFTAPATDAAKQWQGWGTALKPAYEPIVLARKPLSERTVAANVLTYGTGGMNVDGCRVEGTVTTNPSARKAGGISTCGHAGQNETGLERTSEGRWPANLCHDGSDEVLTGFPHSKSGSMKKDYSRQTDDGWGMSSTSRVDASEGSAARFFYCAKASKADRGDGNVHPTVKPTDLMRWLCRLVTPPGGTVFDPFTGSGSTGKAAIKEGFNFVGCEMTPEYATIARARLDHALPE